MKLPFDQNLSFRLCSRVADPFPDSAQVPQIGLDRATDREIWDHAGPNGFTIVTHDSDFANLATLLGPPPKVIWLQCGNQPTNVIEMRLRDNAATIALLEPSPTQSVLEIL